MKKALSILLALALAACMAVPAFADQEELPKYGTQEVKTTVPAPDYTLTVPDATTVNFLETGKKLGVVTVKLNDAWDYTKYPEIQFAARGDLHEASTSSNYFKDTSGNKLRYTLNVYEHTKYGDNVFYVRRVLHAGTNVEAQPFYIFIKEADWRAAVPGDYSATIKYSVAAIRKTSTK